MTIVISRNYLVTEEISWSRFQAVHALTDGTGRSEEELAGLSDAEIAELIQQDCENGEGSWNRADHDLSLTRDAGIHGEYGISVTAE